jgi:hypothetical protein
LFTLIENSHDRYDLCVSTDISPDGSQIAFTAGTLNFLFK